jgi:hypothetical protein
VQGLCNSDQIDGICIKAGILCGRDVEFYFRVRLRRCNLLLACIRRQYLVEERYQRACCLAAAGGTVPCNVMPGAECRQVGEQCFRIDGPGRSIAAGVAGKMIFEAGASASQVLT